MDFIYEASLGIQTIDPIEKDQNKKSLQDIQNKIKNADSLYILGFSFDERNCQRLQLDSWKSKLDPNSQLKYLYFSNFEDRNLINKKAGKLFFNKADSFLPPNFIQKSNLHHSHYEKSTLDVYRALERDFDL